MRLISDQKEINLDEVLTIEMTAEELSIIYAVIGSYSEEEIDAAIESSYNLIPEVKGKLRAGISESIFDDVLDILRQKGVCE